MHAAAFPFILHKHVIVFPCLLLEPNKKQATITSLTSASMARLDGQGMVSSQDEGGRVCFSVLAPLLADIAASSIITTDPLLLSLLMQPLKTLQIQYHRHQTLERRPALP